MGDSGPSLLRINGLGGFDAAVFLATVAAGESRQHLPSVAATAEGGGEEAGGAYASHRVAQPLMLQTPPQRQLSTASRGAFQSPLSFSRPQRRVRRAADFGSADDGITSTQADIRRPRQSTVGSTIGRGFSLPTLHDQSGFSLDGGAVAAAAGQENNGRVTRLAARRASEAVLGSWLDQATAVRQTRSPSRGSGDSMRKRSLLSDRSRRSGRDESEDAVSPGAASEQSKRVRVA